MKEQKHGVTADDIGAIESQIAPQHSTAVSLPEQHMEPLDIIEEPKARTKMRLSAILISLYVMTQTARTHLPSLTRPAGPFHRGPRPDRHRNRNPNHRLRFTFRLGLHLDRRRLPPRQRGRRANLGQNQRHMGPQTGYSMRRPRVRFRQRPRRCKQKHAHADCCKGASGCGGGGRS